MNLLQTIQKKRLIVLFLLLISFLSGAIAHKYRLHQKIPGANYVIGLVKKSFFLDNNSRTDTK